MKKRRFDEGGDVGYDVETTTDEEGNEVTVARKGYSPRAVDTAPRATRTAKAVSKPAVRPVSSSKPSADYVSAARKKYKEAQGYDEASKKQKS